MKRPAFQFYPADWRKDLGLRACSIAARGMWIEILCMAHESQKYGHLVVHGKRMTDAQIASAAGVTASTGTRLIAELEAAGVCSRDDGGALYCRRMVRDERIRNARAEGGKLGGNPALKDNREVGGKVVAKVNLTPNLEPTPSAHVSAPVRPPAASALSSSSSKTEVRLETKLASGANGSDAHPEAEEPQQQMQIKSGWQSPPWVAATAATLGVERRAGEGQADFADRVHTAVDAKRRADKAEGERRQQ